MMITKRAFIRFLGLLGLAGTAAGQSRIKRPDTIPTRYDAALPKGGIRNEKPRNDVCPVCNTAADPYRRPRATDPQSRITRCNFCNAAFWQDAESPGVR